MSIKELWKSIWKDPVWSAVIATALVALATAIGTYFFNYWPTIGNWFGAVSDFLTSRTNVANWLLGLLGLFALCTLFILGLLAWVATRPSDHSNPLPSWQTYTTDTFFGLRWRWQYVGGVIERLTTYCPSCDYQIFSEPTNSYTAFDRIGFKCDCCHRQLGTFDESYQSLESKVERFIHQKIRSGTWEIQKGA